MAKIARANMKIFGASAGFDQIAVFGSLYASSPAYSTDPETIQSLTNYLTGWFGAAIANNSPAIEDMNAICYLYAYQLAYVMQAGIPEWDDATTYYIGSLANDGTGNVYVSLTNTNLNHAVTDTSNWGQRGVLPIGSVIATFPNLTGAYSTSATTAADSKGFVKCNGQTLADALSPMNGQVIPNINNSVFLMGSTTAGTSGGANSTTLTTTQLPAHTHGAGSYVTSVGVTGGTASLTGTTSFATTGHTHDFQHAHQWSYQANTPAFWSRSDVPYSTGSFTTSNTAFYTAGVTVATGANFNIIAWNAANTKLFTAGPTTDGTNLNATTGGASASASVGISSTGASMTGSNSVTGTSSSSGSGTAYDSRPLFISAVYIMRVV